MRLGLLAIFLSLALWVLIKFSQPYRIVVRRLLWGGKDCSFFSWVQVSMEGKGYELLRAFPASRETLSLAYLCRGGLPPKVKTHNLIALDSVCRRLRPYTLRLEIEWVLPKDHDWVEPWQWVGSDTVWGCMPPSPQKVTLIGKPGLHLYPVILPREWAVYPETLWIQGHLAPYAWIRYQTRPQVVGAANYRVVFSPATITVAFQVPKNMASEVSPQALEVLIDMSKVLPQDTVAYVQVRSKKAYIRNLYFYPRAVRFTKIYDR